MISVKLLPNVWDGFKRQFSSMPVEVQQSLLDHIEMKVRGSDQKPVISMIWQTQFCDVIYTAPLQLGVHYQGDDRTITSINGCIYTMDSPQSFDTGEPST